MNLPAIMREHEMNPDADATLHRRGGEKLVDRLIDSGTMKSMVKRVMREAPEKRRDLVIIYDGMEFQSAEIQNLAGQYIFSDAYKEERAKPGARSVRRTWSRLERKTRSRP
jgi:hypothetical protein